MKLWNWFKNLFKKKETPVIKPCEVRKPEPAKQGVSFRWGNKFWDKLLVDSLINHGQNLIGATPGDWNDFTNKYPDDLNGRLLFWGNILCEMAWYESKWKTETKYQENFNDRNGKRIWSRGLFQLSIESGRGYDRTLKDELSLHEPHVNIELAVRVMDKLVGQNGKIAGRSFNKWQGGARYWSVLRGSRDYTKKALEAIRQVNK
jgi:hypothetical protein